MLENGPLSTFRVAAFDDRSMHAIMRCPVRGNAKRRTCDLRGIPGEGKEVSEQLGDTDEE